MNTGFVQDEKELLEERENNLMDTAGPKISRVTVFEDFEPQAFLELKSLDSMVKRPSSS